ncbi:hypothetical protein LTR36_006751 [Oleoguttula mirabilis]|uniref:Uncharacterized protein n=1 Tax=Oleoguttula mirabilis TaxID=1507867 RepID=A0AAV9JCI6_9PEZI|nr:hypothetical protein LTR36_006751 [Oleoguttula mirabilis]
MSSAFNNFRAGLPPPAECLAIGVGCMELTMFGLAGILNPVEFAKGFGVPMTSPSSTGSHAGALEASSEDKTTSEKVKNTQEAYIAAIAARNLQNGILLLTLGCYVRDRRALGIAVAAGLVTTVADAFIVQAYGVKDAMFGHLIGIANSLLIGGSLLYWGRDDKLW